MSCPRSHAASLPRREDAPQGTVWPLHPGGMRSAPGGQPHPHRENSPWWLVVHVGRDSPVHTRGTTDQGETWPGPLLSVKPPPGRELSPLPRPRCSSPTVFPAPARERLFAPPAAPPPARFSCPLPVPLHGTDPLCPGLDKRETPSSPPEAVPGPPLPRCLSSGACGKQAAVPAALKLSSQIPH